MKVMFAYLHGGSNPVLDGIAGGLHRQGFEVTGHSFRALAKGQVGVLHLHWPEVAIQSSRWTRRVLGVARLVATLVTARLRRVPVIWTMHNLTSHELEHQRFERAVRRVCVSLIDRAIAMSDSVAEEASSSIPGLRASKVRVLPHPHYRLDYPPLPSRRVARQRLDLDESAYVILFFGLIRPYKNVPQLITAFSGLEESRATLVVAGAASDDLRDEIESSARGKQNIKLLLRFIEDSEVADLFACADLCVLPFARILNSGSAMLSLSLDTPVALPKLPALRSLQDDFGEAWVRFFEPPLDAEKLIGLMGDRPTDVLRLDDRSPTAVATMTADLYRAVLAKKALQPIRGQRARLDLRRGRCASRGSVRLADQAVFAALRKGMLDVGSRFHLHQASPRQSPQNLFMSIPTWFGYRKVAKGIAPQGESGSH